MRANEMPSVHEAVREDVHDIQRDLSHPMCHSHHGYDSSSSFLLLPVSTGASALPRHISPPVTTVNLDPSPRHTYTGNVSFLLPNHAIVRPCQPPALPSWKRRGLQWLLKRKPNSKVAKDHGKPCSRIREIAVSRRKSTVVCLDVAKKANEPSRNLVVLHKDSKEHICVPGSTASSRNAPPRAFYCQPWSRAWFQDKRCYLSGHSSMLLFPSYTGSWFLGDVGISCPSFCLQNIFWFETLALC